MTDKEKELFNSNIKEFVNNIKEYHKEQEKIRKQQKRESEKKLQKEFYATLPQTFFELFPQKVKKHVRRTLEEYKNIDPKLIRIINQMYGENYTTLNKLNKILKENIEYYQEHFPQFYNKCLEKTEIRKRNFFEYFAEEDREYVLQTIEYYKNKKSPYYDLIEKLYGNTYDNLDLSVSVNLTEEENKIWRNLIANFGNLLKNLEKGTAGKRKRSFFEYFAEEDREYVLQAIEYYKIKKSPYYDWIKKLYGETYDKLNVPISMNLTEEEIRIGLSIINNFKRFMNRIKEGTAGIRKQSFFDYFDENDRDTIIYWIEHYKQKNSKYFKLIEKLYGKKFDKLDILVEIQLTNEERKQFKIFIELLHQKINLKKRKRNFWYIKNNFFDYFTEEEQPYVLQVIEYYKNKKSPYYDLVREYYCDKYDRIVKKIEEDKYEQWKRLIYNFKKQIKNIKNNTLGQRKNSFFDYFNEEDKPYVINVIECYKYINKAYFDLITKLYGFNYDYLNISVELELTDEEKELWRSIVTNSKKMIETHKKNGGKYYKKENFFDYFEKDDKIYVLHLLKYYQLKGSRYYDIVVKLYGEHYNQLNPFAWFKLSQDERKIWSYTNNTIKRLIPKYRENFAFSELDLSILPYLTEEELSELILTESQKSERFVDMLNQSIYMENLLSLLTPKERAYLYLNLKSYTNPELTDEKIAQVLDVEKEYLDDYQIMTNNNYVNALNKCLKK